MEQSYNNLGNKELETKRVITSDRKLREIYCKQIDYKENVQQELEAVFAPVRNALNRSRSLTLTNIYQRILESYQREENQ